MPSSVFGERTEVKTRVAPIGTFAAGCMIAFGCLASVGKAQDGEAKRRPIWPMYRGNAQRTGRSPFRGPAGMRVKWETDLGHEIGACPAVGPAGTIYVGAGPILYAIDPAGRVLWRHDFVKSGHSKEHSECFTSPSPALAPGVLYQAGGLTGKGFIMAVALAADAEPRVKWDFATRHEMRSSPLVVDDSVFVGCRVRRMIVALDRDGRKEWGDTRSSLWSVTSSPALSPDGSTLYIGGFHGGLHAIRRNNGQEKWCLKRDEEAAVCMPETDGKGKTTRLFTTAGHIPEAPAVGDDGTIYCGSWDGFLYAARPDGTRKWCIDLGDRLTSAPAIAEDGRLLISTFEGRLFAIRETGGKPVIDWSVEANARYSSPLISADGTVYVGTLDGRLCAYALADGRQIGEVKLEGSVYASPVPGGAGVLYIGSSDGYLRAIE